VPVKVGFVRLRARQMHCEMEYYLREHLQDYHFDIDKRLSPGFMVEQFRRRWRRPPWDYLERIPRTVWKRTVESFWEQFRGSCHDDCETTAGSWRESL